VRHGRRDALVRAATEGQVPVGPAVDPERVRIVEGVRIAVRRREDQRHRLACRDGAVARHQLGVQFQHLRGAAHRGGQRDVGAEVTLAGGQDGVEQCVGGLPEAGHPPCHSVQGTLGVNRSGSRATP
jgi:hypothetical protein